MEKVDAVADSGLLDYAALTCAVDALGIAYPAQRLVCSADEAVEAAAEFGKPVVLKLMSRDLVHKSDVGAVRLDLSEPAAVRGAATQLVALAASLGLEESGWRILIQEMARSSEVEVFIGVKRDRIFGPVLVVGAGGRLIELLPDRAIGLCPLSIDQAISMLREIPLGKTLGGYRGARNGLLPVAEMMCKISCLPEAIDGLEETDFNPVLLTEKGPLAVDIRAVVSRAGVAPVRSERPTRDMQPLFEPRSIVVIGASSSNSGLPGNRVLGYLGRHGFPGRVHVVHPKAAEVEGFATVPSIEALAGQHVDLACVAVAAEGCAAIIEKLGSIGVRAAVVLSSGFSETGNQRLEEQLAAAAQKTGMLLCGPNAIGVMSPGARVHVSFSQSQDVEKAHAGDIALVTQSGALGGSLVGQAWQRGIGISRFVNVGNQAVLNAADYLNFLADDSTTRTVALLLEGVVDGEALVQAAKRLRAAGKSLVVMKVGQSAEGAKAVQSHTGSVAGNYAVYRAVLRRAGAVLVESITEMLDLLQLRSAGVAIPADPRVAIVSTSGGACAVIADSCRRYGFRVPELSGVLRARLAEALPPFASTVNPIDVTGQVVAEPTMYGRTLSQVLGSDEIDVVVVMLTTIGGKQAETIANEVVKQIVGQPKPTLVSWTMPPELAKEGLAVFARHSIPVFDDPSRAIRAAALSIDARVDRDWISA